MNTKGGVSREVHEPELTAEQRREKRVETLKYRLSMAGIVLLLAFLVFMMFADSVVNFQCSAWETITFKCNRFDAKFKPWNEVSPD